MTKIYHLPILSTIDFGIFRSPGPGLGNLLFPISRAIIKAEETGGTFIMPTIRQIKFGPLIRREPDLRTYGSVFKHRKIQNWLYRTHSIFTRKIPENETHLSGLHTVTYSGLGRYFHDLTEHRSLLVNWLETHCRHSKMIPVSYDIAVHVRLGDFAAYDKDKPHESMQQPFDWYHLAVAKAAKLIGKNNPRIMIFTDAKEENVSDLIQAWSAELDTEKNALRSIQNLSHAKVIVASRSTFSMWGAFLGNCPTIWPEEFNSTPYWPNRPKLDFRIPHLAIDKHKES